MTNQGSEGSSICRSLSHSLSLSLSLSLSKIILHVYLSGVSIKTAIFVKYPAKTGILGAQNINERSKMVSSPSWRYSRRYCIVSTRYRHETSGEEFGDTKGVSIICKSKNDRQYNGQEKKGQTTIYKTLQCFLESFSSIIVAYSRFKGTIKCIA